MCREPYTTLVEFYFFVNGKEKIQITQVGQERQETLNTINKGTFPCGRLTGSG